MNVKEIIAAIQMLSVQTQKEVIHAHAMEVSLVMDGIVQVSTKYLFTLCSQACFPKCLNISGESSNNYFPKKQTLSGFCQ